MIDGDRAHLVLHEVFGGRAPGAADFHRQCLRKLTHQGPRDDLDGANWKARRVQTQAEHAYAVAVHVCVADQVFRRLMCYIRKPGNGGG